MLTFRNSIYIFLTIIATMIVVDFLIDIPMWLYVLPVFLFTVALFYGSYFIHSGFYMPVVCNGNQNEKFVALTFDDGPVESGTPAILDILKHNKVTAAFFCIGNRMKSQPELVKRIINEGHVVGNHSYSHHFFFDLFPKIKMKSELNATNSAVITITNREPRFFRPPYGVTTPVLAQAVNECNMQAVGWSLRSLDTITTDSNKLIDKIEKNVKAGDIILLHDTA